jgi:hypothetical protein
MFYTVSLVSHKFCGILYFPNVISATWCGLLAFMLCHTAWPWRWWNYDPSEGRKIFTQRHTVTSQKTWYLIYLFIYLFISYLATFRMVQTSNNWMLRELPINMKKDARGRWRCQIRRNPLKLRGGTREAKNTSVWKASLRAEIQTQHLL